MLFKEINAVNSENHTKPINTKSKNYCSLKLVGHKVTIRF
jgi:hypothetical protein